MAQDSGHVRYRPAAVTALRDRGPGSVHKLHAAASRPSDQAMVRAASGLME
jgi:hypothetical protein